MLDPAGLRIDLADFALRARHHRTGFVEHDGPRAGRSLVECEDVFHVLRQEVGILAVVKSAAAVLAVHNRRQCPSRSRMSSESSPIRGACASKATSAPMDYGTSKGI